MYKVIDCLTGEIFEFKNQYDAQTRAELQLKMHNSKFVIRRRGVHPSEDAICEFEENCYKICKNN